MSIICHHNNTETEINNVSSIIEHSHVLSLINEENEENEPIIQFVDPEIIELINNFFLLFSENDIQDINIKIENYNYRNQLINNVFNTKQLKYFKDILKGPYGIKFVNYINEIDLEILHNYICLFICRDIMKSKSKANLDKYEEMLVQFGHATLNTIFNYLPKFATNKNKITYKMYVKLLLKIINNTIVPHNLYTLILTILYFRSQELYIHQQMNEEVLQHFNHFTVARLGINSIPLQYLPKLKHLELSCISLRRFPVLNFLESLTMKNKTNIIDLRRYRHFPNLKRLTINFIAHDQNYYSILSTLSYLTNIEELNIIILNYRAQYMFDFQYIENLIKLKKLSITDDRKSQNHTTYCNTHILSKLTNLENTTIDNLEEDFQNII